jgi:hypothetical protein
MPEPSILDARLAEIDRRLRMIQSGLEPLPASPTSLIARRIARPPLTVPADSRDKEVAVLTARLSELTAAHERLLATTQDLMVEQADLLARAAPAVSVAAGPFTDTPALQEFQRALTGLPQVREVAVREYVGSEGVILDVHLQSPIS